MNVFNTLTTNPLSGNFLKPRRALRGSPRKVARIRADPDTLSDKKIMPKSSWSSRNIKVNAFINPSIIVCTDNNKRLKY